jgi:MFS transporter, PPP family, 3-phenylpropionic acid transporter
MAAFFGSIGAWFPYIAVYYASIGLRLDTIGRVVALQAAVSLASAPVWGAIADQLGELRRPLAVATIGTAIAATIVAFAHDEFLVLIGVTAFAVAGSGIVPMLDSRTVDILGADRDRYGRARAWGSVSFVVVSIAVGVVIQQFGPRALFAIYVPGILLTGLLGWTLLGGPSSAGRRLVRVTRGEILALVGRRSLAWFLAGSILFWTSLAGFTTFFSIHLVSLGAPAEVVGLAWALGALAEVPLMLTFHRIVARVGPERLLVVGVVAAAIRAAGFAVAPNLPLTLAVSPLGGIGYALFYVGTVTYVSRIAPPRLQATAQGIFSGAAFSVGTILGSALGGVLAGPFGLRGLFAACAAGAAISAVIVAVAVSSRSSGAPAASGGSSGLR